MDRDTLTSLGPLNPWWQTGTVHRISEFPRRRTRFALALSRFGPERAVLLLGPRQVGKTVLLHHVADELISRRRVPPQSVIYADFGDPLLGGLDIRTLVREAPPPNVLGLPVFLLDEVHSSRDWSRHLRRLVDERAGVFLVADSAAHALSTGMSESGSGRFDEVDIPPLSFAESHILSTLPPEAGPPTTMCEDASIPEPPGLPFEDLERYLLGGGFPGLVRLARDRPEEARRLIRVDIGQRAVFQDISTVRNPFALTDLLRTLVAASRSILDISKLGRQIGATRATLGEWLSLLETTRLIFRVRAFSRSGKGRRGSNPRMMAADPGLVAAFAAVPDPSRDPATRGSLVETAAFRHIREAVQLRGGRVRYYRDGKGRESDFVAVLPQMRVAIEVTADAALDRRKLERFSEVAAREIEAKHALYVSLSPEGREIEGSGIPVFRVPLPHLLWVLSFPGHPEAERWFGATP